MSITAVASCASRIRTKAARELRGATRNPTPRPAIIVRAPSTARTRITRRTEAYASGRSVVDCAASFARNRGSPASLATLINHPVVIANASTPKSDADKTRAATTVMTNVTDLLITSAIVLNATLDAIRRGEPGWVARDTKTERTSLT